MGRRVKPAKAKAEAKRPLAGKTPKEVRDLEQELEARNRELAEAREQQTATSEILRVISGSPTDVQPVFESIAASALRLCDAKLCTVFRFDGKLIHLVALHHVSTEGAAAYRGAYPAPPGRAGGTHRAILTRSIVHIPDIREDPEYELQALARANDFGCVLSVPMLRDEQPIGAITVGREAARRFPDEQIELLKTFAAQAVIAIENVRLFNETKEALEQQTATGEILRVIASSPTDVQPVFAAVAASAARLCDAFDSVIYQRDGDVLRLVGHEGPIPIGPVGAFTIPLSRATHNGRIVLDRRTSQVADLQAEVEEYPEGSAIARRWGHRTVLGVPLLRAGEAIGVITVRRTEVRPFTTRQRELLQTFADQAVIAVENVRLFTELQEKNGALTTANAQVTEALEQQTATSEILKVISGSPTDVQPVFDSIVQSATRLCRGIFATLYRFDGRLIHLLAFHNPTDVPIDSFREAFPAPRDVPSIVTRIIGEGEVLNISDIHAEPELPALSTALTRALGVRSVLAVPMFREGRTVGAVGVMRREVEPFSEGEIELLKTFADQAVIAIENVRLFTELQDKNREIEQKSRELESASQHKSEFLANMSHELRTPLNAIIGFSEVLTERMFGELNEKQDEYLKDIYASGQHLLSLINDILDLSKIEAGRMELEPTDFDLPSAIDNALTLVRERAGRRGITLGREVDQRVGTIRADERKVKQILLNLLSNALKFTPEGGRIDVRAAADDALVEVSVADTGVGIAPEDQEAVFEEFRQVGTADKKVEGTGLGLALSRKFIELHGGRIWVKSQVGMGSTFTFTIPVRREPGERGGAPLP